jgi:putative component of toxin-antitoxin plasmid stabilization module
MLVILLAGGDKSTQAKDIKAAQDLACNYNEDE